jgi:hypothetical protein
MASAVVLDLLKSETFSGLAEHGDPSDAFVGELSVTLCAARNLPSWYFSGPERFFPFSLTILSSVFYSICNLLFDSVFHLFFGFFPIVFLTDNFHPGWSDPYCDLVIDDQRAESKRNSETSHPAGPRDPVWNQVFLPLIF